MADRDKLHGDDATLTTLFRRVLGFPNPRNVKIPDFLQSLGQTIPGEGAEQNRMAQNRFLRDVNGLESHKRFQTLDGLPPIPRETQEQRDARDIGRKMNIRNSIDNARGLSIEQKIKAQQMLDNNDMHNLRKLIFPHGSPGVTI